MLVWGFFRVAFGFLEGLFVVDFPFSHDFLDPLSGFQGWLTLCCWLSDTFCFPRSSLTLLLMASEGWLALCCWLSVSRSWSPCILCWCSAVTDFVLWVPASDVWGDWLGWLTLSLSQTVYCWIWHVKQEGGDQASTIGFVNELKLDWASKDADLQIVGKSHQEKLDFKFQSIPMGFCLGWTTRCIGGQNCDTLSMAENETFLMF